jgi:hypothetical protein
MNEVIVTCRLKDIKYNGFDFYGSWKSLDKWNNKNASIRLFDDATYAGSDIELILEYCAFLSTQSNDYNINLICINNPFPGFSFIGYDCGFLREDGDVLLFSTLFNELRGTNTLYFKQYIETLNDYFLFDKIEDAKDYVCFRNSQKTNGLVNLETAYTDLTIDIVPVYLFPR